MIILLCFTGEVDIRGVYCALVVATLTNICSEKLFDGTPEWVVSCQTYEGGFSGSPGMEAHGGYTFCGLAALELFKKSHLCDLKSLLVRFIIIACSIFQKMRVTFKSIL